MRTLALAAVAALLLAEVTLLREAPGRLDASRTGVLPSPASDPSGGKPETRVRPLPETHAAIQRPETVQEIATDTLMDVAVAEYGEHGSVIYYNPAALQQLGPEVGAFLMAHERGHIHLRHTRANALLAGRSALDSVLQGRELAADCYAARALGREDRTAVIEAVRFFGRLGSLQLDAAHPTGARRAATILSCIPVDSTPRDPAPALGQ